MRSFALVLLALAACGGAGGPAITDANNGDGAGSPDAPGTCNVSITFDPDPAVAQPDTVVRAISHVANAPGVQTFTWHVLRGPTMIPTDPAQDDYSQALFPAIVAASYDVFLDVDVAGVFCPQGQATLTVSAPGANEATMRIHVTPPPSEQLPPLDKLVIVHGGGDQTLPDVVLDPGVVVNGNVLGSGIGIPSYLRFMPISGKEAVVESFSDGAGGFTARVLDQPHDVLVVPATASFPPTLVKNWLPSQTNLAVDPGTAISGVVRDQANALLAGAKVQLSIDGTPSTLATTNAAGAFTVRAALVTGATVRFDVTPPATSGLPRLSASSTTFDLAQAVAIKFSATTIRDLANTLVRRSGAPLANAKVSVVGALAAPAGTVTAGVVASASGEIRITATTDGAGRLPSMKATANVLSAVVEPGPGDAAVTALDLTGGVPATIDALALQPVTTVIHAPTAGVLAGVTLDAVPLGALQLAGAPSVHATSGVGGTISTSFAPGGHYQLRFSDAAGRGAMLIVPDVTSASIAANHTLHTPVHVGATVKGETSVIRGASVQMLCAVCSGIERSRPLAEIATGNDGKFLLAVPDPGTN